MKVGNKVVCVDDKFSLQISLIYTELPVQDNVYTVRSVFLGRMTFVERDASGAIIKNGSADKHGATVAILLNEIKNPEDPCCPNRELSFNSERFRVIDEESNSEVLHNSDIDENQGEEWKSAD